MSGLVYVAAEGINGTVAGAQETVDAWLNALEQMGFIGIGHARLLRSLTRSAVSEFGLKGAWCLWC